MECNLEKRYGEVLCDEDCEHCNERNRSGVTDRWIPVSKRLPEEKINPITKDFYEYQCTYHAHGIYDVRSYKYGNGHWWHGAGIMDDCVIAWIPRPEPYNG